MGNDHLARGIISTFLCGLFLGIGTSCVSVPPLGVEATQYRIEVRLEPASNSLAGRTTMEVMRTDDNPLAADEDVAVQFLLHPDLKVESVEVAGIETEYRRGALVKPTGESGFAPRRHQVVLRNPPDAMTLTVKYAGKVFQDVAAGEKEGEIHNFAMRAHVGSDGIYLAGGYWYPEPELDEDDPPRLATYTLLVEPCAGMALEAGAERDHTLSRETGWLAWRSPYPLDGMVLVGGPHEVHEQARGHTTLRLHLKPSQAEQAEGLFEALQRYLDRYEPLIGPYPASEFSIVDNFFSSGFAFPTFTLLAAAVIDMGPRSRDAHGYIDHELLHCWWGNGIHVDPKDGNWCEAFASYGANYYGYVLDGKDDEARRQRRNYCHFLSRLKPDQDKPLGTFGQDEGCGRGIAYNKGAMVLHMLARKIGQDKFWAALRRFTDEYVGRYANWDDIRRLCEEIGDVDLELFFRQWVRSGGAPSLAIEDARLEEDGHVLVLDVSQGEPAFSLDVPVRIAHDEGVQDIVVPLDAPSDTLRIPVDLPPLTVEVDPDYHIFRRVPPTDIIPTTATTRAGEALISATPGGEFAEGYDAVRDVFEESFDKGERDSAVAGELDATLLTQRSVLLLGEAVREPGVAAFLQSIEFPVRWTEAGFEFEGRSYVDAGDAVLCTVVHPQVERAGVTVVFANSEAALPRAFTIPFYDRSLVIFQDGQAVHRADFEPRHTVSVRR